MLRFFLISTHYRSPIDLGEFKTGETPPGILNAARAYDTFTRFAERYRRTTGKDFYALAGPRTAGSLGETAITSTPCAVHWSTRATASEASPLVGPS